MRTGAITVGRASFGRAAAAPCLLELRRVPLRPLATGRRARRGEEAAFDKDAFLRKEEFDLLSAQDFRREALLQYGSTNQSEPLRIALSLLGLFVSLGAPFLAPGNAGPPFFVGVLLLFLASGFFFLQENGKRTRQLVRLQREYSLGDLAVELENPTTRLVRRPMLRAFRGQRRIVALFGSENQLCEALAEAAPYRRRFERSGALLVPIASGEPAEAEAAAAAALGGARVGWLASAASPRRWRAYFEDLQADRGGGAGRGLWVALNFRGRVIGSSFGSPVWDELLAAMPPENALLSTEPAYPEAAPADALAAQAAFYSALCAGDEAAVDALFLREEDAELSFALEADDSGAQSNLSGWDAVLAEGARPELVVADQDAVLRRSDEAVTTCIEHPVLGPTLLATQVWRRVLVESGGEEWRLVTHRTIPYAPGVEARVALRCDHRGCIAFGKQLDAMR